MKARAVITADGAAMVEIAREEGDEFPPVLSTHEADRLADQIRDAAHEARANNRARAAKRDSRI
jgi:hypothetical protein